MTEPQLIELTETGSDIARQAFALYEASFPPAERVPVEAMQRTVERWAHARPENGSMPHFWIAIRDEQVLGLSSWSYFCKPRLGFLYYLAVDPATRGQGLGAWLLQKTLEHLQADASACDGAPPRGLIWEVERPADAAVPAERDLRQRRIHFYQRSGSLLLPQLDFLAPPLAPGLAEVPYHVMFLPSASFDGDTASRGFHIDILDTILLEGYGIERGSAYYLKAVKSILNNGLREMGDESTP
jgi:GNAT superfamily N-acetyltransferase